MLFGGFKSLVDQDRSLKRLCVDYLEKFKQEHEHEWDYNEKEKVFTDKNNRYVVRAYILNGILYDNQRQPVLLKALDMPKNICIDVWYLIMRYLNGQYIMNMEYLCKNMYKAAQRIWTERGRSLSKQFGPVFDAILGKHTYAQFYHLCFKKTWSHEWLPFEVLFRLPPGTAKEYLGRKGRCFALGSYKTTFGVIVATDGDHVGFVQRLRQETVVFFWGKTRAKREVKMGSWTFEVDMSADRVLNGLVKIKSVVDHWSQYKILAAK